MPARSLAAAAGVGAPLQAGFPRSEALLERVCTERGLRLHKLLRMSEFIKADGALTCCSILLPPAAPSHV